MMNLTWATKLPEAWRLLRMSWKPSRIAAVALFSVIISTLITAYLYLSEIGPINPGTNKPDFPFETLSFIMFFIQALLWVVCVPAAIGNAVMEEFTIGTWVFQQTAPQSARKLLLGKIVGAPGDIYVAVAANLPFLAISVFLSNIPIANYILVYAFMLIFSIFISTLFLYLSCIFEKQRIPILLFIVAVPIFLISTMDRYYMYTIPDNLSLYGFHPYCIFSTYILNNWNDWHSSAEHFKQYFILFYGIKFSPVILASAVYMICSFCLFFASERQLRRKMAMPVNRVPILFAFVLFFFFFLGFLHEYIFPLKAVAHRYYSPLTSIGYFLVTLIFIYSAMFMNTLTLGEMRPWLYRWASGKLKVVDYFAGDAPSIFIMFALAIAVMAGHMILAFLVYQSFGITPSYLWPLLSFFIVVIRDTLFFQAMKIGFKKGALIGLFVYLLGFIALPGLSSFFIHSSKFQICLTPAIVFYTDDIRYKINMTNPHDLTAAIWINLVLLFVFGYINYLLLTRAKKRFKQPEA